MRWWRRVSLARLPGWVWCSPAAARAGSKATTWSWSCRRERQEAWEDVVGLGQVQPFADRRRDLVAVAGQVLGQVDHRLEGDVLVAEQPDQHRAGQRADLLGSGDRSRTVLRAQGSSGGEHGRREVQVEGGVGPQRRGCSRQRLGREHRGPVVLRGHRGPVDLGVVRVVVLVGPAEERQRECGVGEDAEGASAQHLEGLLTSVVVGGGAGLQGAGDLVGEGEEAERIRRVAAGEEGAGAVVGGAAQVEGVAPSLLLRCGVGAGAVGGGDLRLGQGQQPTGGKGAEGLGELGVHPGSRPAAQARGSRCTRSMASAISRWAASGDVCRDTASSAGANSSMRSPAAPSSRTCLRGGASNGTSWATAQA